MTKSDLFEKNTFFQGLSLLTEVATAEGRF